MGHRNKVTHSEDWWDMLAPPTVLRCEGHYKQDGKQCRREAVPGANVCGQHGGLIPVVRDRAAARMGNAADDMVQRLLAWLDDPGVDARDKVKIAQDMLDRAGLNATGKLLVGIGAVDPVEALFRNILNDPNGLAPAQPIAHQPSPEVLAWNLEALDEDEPDDIVEAEVVEDSAPTAPSDETMKTTPPPHIRRDLERLGLL
ncbi:hypothetical protein [Nocardioides sp.]|uniref:hypothetical protein n=1 Tax=Nocardioides sp. TaxID=35761 RepID=UPI002622360A|nr:hypothetical protein [Nocardioides sp.]MCW2738884.1 hypothetical protein [Nocardioides sp.]